MFLLSACGSQGNNPNDGGTDTIIDLAEGGTCSSALQCAGGSVCNPSTNLCTPSLSCTMHNDCGPAAHCDSNHVCQRSVTASPCNDDMNCSGAQRCVGGHCGCNGEVYGAQHVNPNMLIVLDRSSSMNQASGGSGSPSKWNAAKSAITSLVNTYSDRVRFGLKLYPGTNAPCTEPAGSCKDGYIPVAVPAASASAITSAMGSVSTCTKGTPTGEAIQSLASYSPLEDTARPNYVLLLTDGEHTSSCLDPTPQVANLLSQNPSIKTYVIGFGSGVNATELNALATAGGTARSGTGAKYYQANSQSELQAAFNTIVSGVVSCSYTLSTTPPTVSQLYVYFGNTQVQRDTTHAMGWDYEAGTNQVTFYGATCDQLKSGAVTDLSIIYGCPIIVR